MTPKRKRPRARPRPPRFLPYLSDSPETRAAELARFREYSRGRPRPAPRPKAPPAPRVPRERDPDRLYADEKANAVRVGRDFYADRSGGSALGPIDNYASDLALSAFHGLGGSRRRRVPRALVEAAADYVAIGFRSEREKAYKKAKKAGPRALAAFLFAEESGESPDLDRSEVEGLLIRAGIDSETARAFAVDVAPAPAP